MALALTILQILISLVVGAYFLRQLQKEREARPRAEPAGVELDRLRRMRAIHLTKPLNETVRPRAFGEIVGQEEGVRALKAVLFGENPQHVIIYGPPGVGKTCAARLVMEKAKNNPHSPFRPDAKFIEIDATCLRCDERNIADPLIGSVHDPIYQGAGAYGHAGVPSPKEGAVTRAHGGILFLDEIGELHPLHLNKLLKVMEDRKVFLESAYYSRENRNIPRHVHDIFSHGLPADFRLVGATTKSPREIPQAIRSRCMEIYFRPLYPEEIVRIAQNAAAKTGMILCDEVAAMVGEYAQNGRDAVNMVQLAAGIAREQGESRLLQRHIAWVVEMGRYTKRPALRLGPAAVGCVNGLGIYGAMTGVIIEVETVAIRSASGGSLTVTGLVEEEETQMDSRRYRRKSTAKSSVENVLTAYAEEQNKMESLRLAERAANRSAEVALLKYEAGLSDFLTVLVAQRSLLSAQDQLAKSRGVVTSNLIKLYKALGGGWESMASREEEKTDTRKTHENED